MKRGRTGYFYFIAFALTVLFSFYQRLVVPTSPKVIRTTIEQTPYKFKLKKSNNGENPCFLKLKIKDDKISGKFHYRRYPTQENYKTIAMNRSGKHLEVEIPHQKAAGKLQYYVELVLGDKSFFLEQDSPVIIRFRDSVPALVLVPHIVFMFLTMMFSILALLFAFAKDMKFKTFTFITFLCIILGGFIFGTIMQKYAFGVFWSGFPFGWDLTDNKTLIAGIFYLIAVIANYKRTSPWATIIASIILIITFIIPHSFMGSELDYDSGVVNSGFITFFK